MAALLAAGAVACATRGATLGGTRVPADLPDTRLSGSRQLVFRWDYEEGSIVARGEGVARVTAPDSARLDFFLDGGFGGGYTLVFGDTIVAPGGALVRNMLPSPPLLWASIGRLAVPPARDTIAAVDGTILRADIGRDPTWRVTFDGNRLARLERMDQGRTTESVTRGADGAVRYEHPGDRRLLRITVTRVEEVRGFDASIWRVP